MCESWQRPEISVSHLRAWAGDGSWSVTRARGRRLRFHRARRQKGDVKFACLARAPREGRAPGLRMGERACRGCDYCLASRRGLPSTGKTVVKECFRVARPETIAKGDRHFPASGAYMS